MVLNMLIETFLHQTQSPIQQYPRLQIYLDFLQLNFRVH